MKVFFRDGDHSYFNEEGVNYVSVSHIGKLITPKKDWRQQADWSAIKYNREKGTNLTGQDLFDKWELKKKLSTEAGTIIHSIEEQALLNCPHPIFYGTACSIKPCSFFDGLKVSIPIEGLDNNTVYPELIIYNHKLKLAGQADKAIIVDNTIHIWDFKTDDIIKYEGYNGQTLLAPCSHIPDCNFEMYALKMSLYMHLLHKQNLHLKTGELVLERRVIERDEEGIPILYDGIPKVIKKEDLQLPYREKEVINICKAYLKGKL